VIGQLRRDPAAPSVAVFLAMVVGGFVAIGLAWNIARQTLIVAFQLPGLLSGAVGGLALIVLGAGLINAQVGRRLGALERARTDAVLDEAAALLAALDRAELPRRSA
jgi:hypothetical protein